MRIFFRFFCVFSITTLIGCNFFQKYKDYPISMVDIKNVELTDSFWLPKIKMIQDVTVPYAFEKCRKEGRMESFLIAGQKVKGKVRGKMPFDDSDLYKIIEGASYSLLSKPNKQLEEYLDSVIDIIKTGQEPDGYITTWFTIDPNNPPAPWVQKTGKRWTGESSSHELYNSGHLFEAAVAHFEVTGKRNFLDIAIKNADLLVNSFGHGKITQPPGHQIVETGLIKLYRVTNNVKYLKLARYFLDIRGDSTTHKLYGAYSQDHIPVTQQTEIVGHAVRAVYMYAAMTDIAAIYNDHAYFDAVTKIWNNMVERKMYITGGIGAKHEGESLGNNYELPNLTSYSETCAAIGDVYWNYRLFLLTGDSKYFDIIERTLYNGLISGLSLDGKNFFYVNPLEADGKFKFNQGKSTRQPWFDCSCCPTNLIRFIPSIPGLIYALRKDTVYVNLYASNKVTIKVDNTPVDIEQLTDYPWHGKVILKINPKKPVMLTLKLRIPCWARNRVIPGNLYSFTTYTNKTVNININGKSVKYECETGYATISRDWLAGDNVDIDLPMEIRNVKADDKIKADNNLASIEYGPLMYCVEGVDNKNILDLLTLPDNANLTVEKKNNVLNGIPLVIGNVPNISGKGALKLTAVPYFAWSNRNDGPMKVWLPRR